MTGKLSVVGTGNIGLSTAIGLAEFGNRVISVDKDDERIELLRTGQSPLR